MDSATKEMVDAFQGKMLNFNVLLRQIVNKNVTEGKIDISMMVDKNENYKKAIVISIGSECPKGDILVGDTVIFDNNRASAFTQNTIEYKSIPYADLVHVL